MYVARTLETYVTRATEQVPGRVVDRGQTGR